MYHFCVFYRVCFIVYFIVYAAFVGFVRIKLMMMMSVDWTINRKQLRRDKNKLTAISWNSINPEIPIPVYM